MTFPKWHLSDKQRPILQFIADGHAEGLVWNGGEIRHSRDPDPVRGFKWRMCLPERRKNSPNCDARSVGGLVDRGLLRSMGNGNYDITNKGREALTK